ncbi:DNA repair protein RecN [Candidatus Schmidhempelia bombi]|jgi:DNA repair protein RecN (Recombination protein N)|uniref:DNA repair protein RecN n=1 Tax=Candidatus Schmidhempelia bombi str. Bimp TaxID=1387197 RepID=A0AB94IF83_9GAMM|nr:DNA repair protein RecN [Candidatus Schmidhempelia bombi]TEA28171.1 DNA repair protein RecN [Candidatus Schmidhempelia bombi str. Bimp]
MITQLTINNFAIVDKLTIEFAQGMTAITGETGAGKSIAIDALGLCLGLRADSTVVRFGAERADITAHFLLNDTPTASAWLRENQLNDGNECILRRVINSDGRSRAFINGSAVPIAQLRELGQKLIQIHGQHEHQLLMKSEHQQALLNHYMGETSLLRDMRLQYQRWKAACQTFALHEKQRQERESYLQLLQYQLKELNEFAPQEGEFEKIDEEYRRLSNSEQLITLSQQTAMLLAEQDEYNVLSTLNQAKNRVQDLIALDPHFVDVFTMLDEAAIQIAEASHELRHYAENRELDPAYIAALEKRLSKQIALARKHNIAPQQLPAFYQEKLAELSNYQHFDQQSSQLQMNIDTSYQQALILAKKLHEKRIKTAKTLAKAITQSMRELSMTHGQFNIDIVYDEQNLHEDGGDSVIFMVTTNPGQPLQPIAKIASGGELSRIALAIQVLTAKKIEMPVLIFDEIDVGISGPTAAKVGNLLRELGQSTQVITVTHLPQVAGNANQHFFVAKHSDDQQTTTTMCPLDKEGRVAELARLLGGNKITDNTLANAKELFVDIAF